MSDSGGIQIGGETAVQALRPLLIICAVFIFLDTLFVVLRFTSRLIVKRTAFGWDDCWIIPSYLFNISACVVGLLIVHYQSIGNGPADAPTIEPWQIQTQLEPTLKCVYALVQLLIPGFTLPKLSILCLYLRIFTGPKTRGAAWVLIFLVLLSWVAYGFTGAFLCTPLEFFWDKTIEGGTCLDINFYYRSFGLPNILIDTAIIVLPLPAVWRMDATRLRKVGITCTFLTGTAAVIASCIRWAIFAEHDGTYISPSICSTLIFMNIIECSMYLICACLPASYPLARRIFGPSTSRFTIVQPISHPTRSRATFTQLHDYGVEMLPNGVEKQQGTRPGLGRNDSLAPLFVPGEYPASASRDPKNGGISPVGTRSDARLGLGALAGDAKALRVMGVEDRSPGMRMLSEGEGMLVTTEITVTTEQRIADVLGM